MNKVINKKIKTQLLFLKKGFRDDHMQPTCLQFVSGLRFQYSIYRITSGGFRGGAQGARPFYFE